jgi:probable rRNA maturation factor
MRQHRPKPIESEVNRPSLSLSLQFADTTDRSLLPRHKVLRWLRAALSEPAEITVRLVDAQEGRKLNRDYRSLDHATNVLTFDYQREPAVVADLIICGPVVRREAARQHIDLQAHYAHMLVHGALHAQGMDHRDDAEARSMESAESKILQSLGFADPYRR